jgi:WD40 repeat protein
MSWRRLLIFVSFLFPGIIVVAILSRTSTSACSGFEYDGNYKTEISHDDLAFLLTIPGKGLILTGSRDGRVNIWEETSFRLVRSLELPSGITGLCASIDGQLLAAETDKTTIITVANWQMRDLGILSLKQQLFGLNHQLVFIGQEEKVKRVFLRKPEEVEMLFNDMPASVRSICVGRERSLVAIGCWDGAVKVWDSDKQELILTAKEHSGNVRALLFVGDDRFLISGDSSGLLILWDLKDRKRIRERQAHGGGISALQASPGGTYLFSSGFDSYIRAWNLVTLSACGELEASRFTSATALAVSSNAKKLYYGLPTGEVWEVKIKDVGVNN